VAHSFGVLATCLTVANFFGGHARRKRVGNLSASCRRARNALSFRVNFNILAVVHAHSDSVLALRIVFSVCLAIVLLSGIYIFRIRKKLFDRDPEVVADHWAARNLRLWQVILVWLLAVDLLVTMLWRL
jgi:hypothetical protein